MWRRTDHYVIQTGVVSRFGGRETRPRHEQRREHMEKDISLIKTALEVIAGSLLITQCHVAIRDIQCTIEGRAAVKYNRGDAQQGECTTGGGAAAKYNRGNAQQGNAQQGEEQLLSTTGGLHNRGESSFQVQQAWL